MLGLILLISCFGDEKPSENLDSGSASNSTPVVGENIGESLNEISLTPMDYLVWLDDVEHNTLIKKKTIGEFNYTLKYLPIEYMICNETKGKEISSTEEDALYEQYEGMHYFQLQIDIDGFTDEIAKFGLSDMQKYQQRIGYMAFDMQDDISGIVNNTNEISCKLYHFERTYGVAPYAKFLMAFSKEDMNDPVQNITIIFNDNLFNKGLLKFSWSIDQLLNVPKIQVV